MIRGPVRHEPLVTQVASQFRELIDAGDWPVGERIPGEHQLADDLGVSRATVREALRGLSITGLLEPRIGDGTYVRATDEITGVLVRDHLPTAADRVAAPGDVLDARAALEAAGARLAAQRADPDDLAALRAALDARTAAHDASDLAGYVATDTTFHQVVVRASGNPILIRLYAAVSEIVQQSIRETAVLPEPDAVRDAHRELTHAICAGDVESATRLGYALIDSVKAAPAPADQLPPTPTKEHPCS
ncbi:FadR/GntR family transcriptional regulator [Micropruina sp.]|uniref:FadR/GntR family transcriptional regulator n=1 Tax=Micropruina sp. TaxID=2737536 RepID=UPI0039E5F4E2